MISRPVRSAAHVGRADELEHLVARRKAAGDGRGGMVVVVGEAGIGKSRLIAEFARRVARGSGRIGRVECRSFARDAFGPLDEMLEALDSQWRRARTFATAGERLDAIARAFERLATRRTTVAIFEDIHCAEPDFVATLRLLATRAASRRLLLVATIRDSALVPANPGFIALGALLREHSVSTVTLAPLDTAATNAMLHHILEGSHTLATFVRDDIVRRCDGNPLFAQELVRDAVDRAARGLLANLDDVPLTLEAVVRERLESCPRAQRKLLAAASLCGRIFQRDVLDIVAGETSAARDAELANLCKVRLLVALEGKPQRYAFHHALVRDVLYAEISAARAKPVHAEIARALAALPDADDRAIDIADHYYRAEQFTAGASAFAAAARAARSTLAYAEAVRWYERAADAHDDESEADSLRLELARTYAAAEQLARALELYAELVAKAQRRGDVAFVVRARKLIAGLLSNDGRRDEAIATLELTLGDLPPDDRETRADLLVRVTTIHAMRQRTDEARATLARFQPEDLGAGTASFAEFLLLRAQLNARDGRRAAWHDDFARACAIFEALPAGRPFVRFSHVVFAWQAWSLGLIDLSRAHLELARMASEESAAANSDVPLMLALVELHAGRFDLAERRLAGVPATGSLMARKLRAQIGVEIAVARADETMAAAYLDLALVEEAERKDDAYGVVRMCCSFGAGLALLGRDAEARAAFGRAAKRIESVYEFVPAILTLVAHRPDLRPQLRALFAASASLDPRFRAAAVHLIDAEASSNDTAAARHDAREAMRLFDELGWAALAARAAERVDRRDALDRYRRIGHIAAVRRLAQDPARETPGASVLTARESQVVRVLARGTSNRDAAAALAISEKTVEKHISSVYRKLGFRSRSELLTFARSSDGRVAPHRPRGDASL